MAFDEDALSFSCGDRGQALDLFTLPDGDGTLRRVTSGPWVQATGHKNDSIDDATEELLEAEGTPIETTLGLDVMGNPLTVLDARANVIQTQDFDLLGRPITTSSPDGGDATTLLDATGQPLLVWRSGDLAVEVELDGLRRKIRTWEWNTDTETRVLRERFVYGEQLYDEGVYEPADDNLRARLYRVYDTAGFLELSYDWKGNPLSTSRRFLEDDEADIDWTPHDDDDPATLHTAAEAELEADPFTVAQTWDAMNRLVTRTAPNGAETTNSYDDGGRLIVVEVDANTYVEDIQYNARGQRTDIVYGNGVSTTYTYEADTFRLSTLTTTRESDDPGDPLQALIYTYDPVGNIVSIVNEAEDTFFYDNTAVEPSQTFGYDALYRLIQAAGREKLARGQADWAEPSFGPVPTTDLLQTYEQLYTYDDVGNILVMEHNASVSGDWTRTYGIDTGSNRLLTTTESVGTYTYQHDARGNIIFMPHLYNDGATPSPTPNITPDFRDQMRRAQKSASAYSVYFYDHTGERARKVVKTSTNVEDRRYVAGYEVWSKSTSGDLQEQRTTEHVMDGERRIAMVETKTWESGTEVSPLVPVVRYQLDNHLGTSLLELNEDAEIISYEEYHPYGTTAWWAGDSGEVSLKRYRYTGKEKDEETGLSYHSARYYATWLGRWTSADPIGLGDGANRFLYCHGAPTRSRDTTGTTDKPIEVVNPETAETTMAPEATVDPLSPILPPPDRKLPELAGVKIIPIDIRVPDATEVADNVLGPVPVAERSSLVFHLPSETSVVVVAEEMVTDIEWTEPKKGVFGKPGKHSARREHTPGFAEVDPSATTTSMIPLHYKPGHKPEPFETDTSGKILKDSHTLNLNLADSEAAMTEAKGKGLRPDSESWTATSHFWGVATAWDSKGHLVGKAEYGFVLTVNFDASSKKVTASLVYEGDIRKIDKQLYVIPIPAPRSK